MTREQAVGLVSEMVTAEVELMKQFNNGSGRVSKRVEKRERDAASALFVTLVGDGPTPAEIDAMVSN